MINGTSIKHLWGRVHIRIRYLQLTPSVAKLNIAYFSGSCLALKARTFRQRYILFNYFTRVWTEYISCGKHVEMKSNSKLSASLSYYRLHKRIVRIPATTRVRCSSVIRGSSNKAKGSPLAVPAVTIRKA